MNSEKTARKALIGTIIGLSAAATIALGALAFILTSDTHRLKRNLELAQRYFDEENYEEAIVLFDKAIEIDERCIDAYLGKLNAYEEIGDVNNLQGYYDELVDIVCDWDAEYTESIQDELQEVFLEAKEVYPDDELKIFNVLEEGLSVTNDSEDLMNSYINAGISVADSYEAVGNYDESLAIYDRVLVHSTDSKIVTSLGDCVQEYLDILLNNHEYDKAEAIVDKYGDVLSTLDLSKYKERAEELREYYSMLTDYLTLIAARCQAEDYDGAFELMHTDEYEQIINYVDEVGEIKAFDTIYGQIGVYIAETVKFSNHMIYYGDYAGDIRNGNGVWLAYYEGNNYYAVGEWVNDTPNGNQSVREWSDQLNDNVVYRVLNGTVANGLWNGAVTWGFEYTGGLNQFDVSFDNGYWVIVDTNPDAQDGYNYIYCEKGTDQNGNEIGSLVGTDADNYILHGILGFDTYE